MAKLEQKQMEAVYEAIVDWFVRKGYGTEEYVRENCWLRPDYVWSGDAYDAINSEGLYYEWVHYAPHDPKVEAVAKKNKVFLEPYTGWSLGMYPAWEVVKNGDKFELVDL